MVNRTTGELERSMTYELVAIALVWLLIFALMQASMPFASAIYKAGVAPPWPSRALTAGTATGFVACMLLSNRSVDPLLSELILIAVIAFAEALCAAANRWFFKRWW